MEHLILQIMAVIFGASIGSFLNVVIYRVPAGLSLLFPPSRCPHCLKQLSPRDNIPILGWFLIKGKCRQCHSPVSWRYPLIETLTAILFWGVAAYFGFSKPIILLLFYCAFLSWLLSLSIIDLDTMTLPNALTQSGLIMGVAYHVALALNMSTTKPLLTNLANEAILAVTGAVVGIWLLDIMRILGRVLLQKEAMGAGDAKLAAMLGVWLGWQQLLLAVFIAAALGTVMSLGAIVLKKLSMKHLVPFGPFLAVGGAIALFLGEQILSTYLNWFGLIS